MAVWPNYLPMIVVAFFPPPLRIPVRAPNGDVEMSWRRSKRVKDSF